MNHIHGEYSKLIMEKEQRERKPIKRVGIIFFDFGQLLALCIGDDCNCMDLRRICWSANFFLYEKKKLTGRNT